MLRKVQHVPLKKKQNVFISSIFIDIRVESVDLSWIQSA